MFEDDEGRSVNNELAERLGESKTAMAEVFRNPGLRKVNALSCLCSGLLVASLQPPGVANVRALFDLVLRSIDRRI